MIKIIYTMAEMSNKQKELSGKIKTLKEKLSTQNRHPYCDKNLFTDIINTEKALLDSLTQLNLKIKEMNETLTNLAKERENEITKSLETDLILKAINDYFIVGEEFTFDELMGIAKEGSFRYSQKIPPGYEDEKEKIGLQVYGDLVLWKQLLNYAFINEKSVIFVNNEKKQDWLDNRNENKPRYELLKEFNGIANKRFWMLNLSVFLHKTNTVLEDICLSEDVLLEVKQQQNENLIKISHSSGTIYDGWKEAYTSFIRENIETDPSDTGYSLVHINDDGIPELVIDYRITVAGGAILNFFNGEMDAAFISVGGVEYIEEENLFMQSSGRMGYYEDTVYSIQNGKVIVLHRGSWEEEESSKSLTDENCALTYCYFWDDVEVTKEEYEENLLSAFDSEKADSTELVSKNVNEIIDIINSY